MTASALLIALLAAPAAAADIRPPNAAMDLLVESFGAPGVETLAARGLIVLHGGPKARRVAAVHWKALGELANAASSCLALAAAADSLGHEPAPAAPALDLAACRALPADGIMTPSLHALAAALEAGHEERWALRLANAPPAGVPGRPNLFDTAWGKDLIARRHADALENPVALARPLFDDLLSGPRPDKDAAALICAEAAARGAASLDKLIAADAAAGALSEELRAQLRRTLSNERRRWAAEKARAAAADLLAKAAVKRELEDLRGAAKVLSSRPALAASLETAVGRAPSLEPGARLRSAGLHLQEPTRLGQHELGDEAIVSGAYWVDGLGEGESIDVDESIAVETERGFPSVATRVFKRKNGGPYPYSRALKIAETRPFALRSLISTGGLPLDERVEVPLAPDFELALLKESEAAGLRANCRLKDAESAYAALAALVAEPAKVKPQYKALVARAAKANDALKADGETLLKLEERLAAARGDSSPQLCKYETARVDEALKLSKRLPAGCDRDLPELQTLRSTIMRRAADQAWFLKASADARSKRKSCDLEGARARWSEALAALDVDPGARCGRVAEEEARARTESAETGRKIAWREDLGKSLAKAEGETAPAKRLELLRPVTSRLGALGALDVGCLGAEAKRASTLSAAASKSLTAPADAETARRLPPENALASAVAEVRAERARRLEAAGAAEKAAVEPSAPPAVEAPKAEPAVKPAAKKAVKRPQRGTKAAR